MKYHLRIYDNFHYGDETEAYNHGGYATYEEALSAAQSIVDDFLRSNWKKGMTSDELMAQFLLYGEDPIIVPDDSDAHERFSARTYANICAIEICERLEKLHSR